MEPSRAAKSLGAAAVVLGIGLVAGVDYATGIEIHVLPLYYLPLSLAAWHFRRPGALAAATVCALAWFGANHLSGQAYSQSSIWVINTMMQGASFMVVGLLVATLRDRATRADALSRTDPLTSLPNSRAFYTDASRILALSRRLGQAVTMAYVDLDNFKAVNDTLGHQGGDDLLRRVAELIRTCIRATDASARIGGDEFVLCLLATDQDRALELLERLRRLLAEAFATQVCPVTASIGGVTFESPPPSVEAMVREADRRMYAAKAGGRNRVLLEVIGAVTSAPDEARRIGALAS